jgi:hypothetical protein
MGNLLSEYRRRHNSNFIWASNDGVCFFNKNKKPAAICLLTDYCRTVTTCEFCHIQHPKFVCEVLAPGERGSSSRSVINILFHEHVNVDIDISKVMETLDKEYIPYHAKDQNDIEAWLWNFYLQLRPFSRHAAFDQYVKQQDKRNSNVMRSLDQMMWAATNIPSQYSLYYERLYQPVLIGRNYLLYK